MKKAYVSYLEEGESGYQADWADERHHFRRLVSEFIGSFGFVFALSGGAAIFHGYAHPALMPGEDAFLLAMAAGLWLVIAIYAFRDISAQFNPALTLAFALRGDMSWRRAMAFWGAQCAGGIAAASMARGFFGWRAASQRLTLRRAMPCRRSSIKSFLQECSFSSCLPLRVAQS